MLVSVAGSPAREALLTHTCLFSPVHAGIASVARHAGEVRPPRRTCSRRAGRSAPLPPDLQRQPGGHRVLARPLPQQPGHGGRPWSGGQRCTEHSRLSYRAPAHRGPAGRAAARQPSATASDGGRPCAASSGDLGRPHQLAGRARGRGPRRRGRVDDTIACERCSQERRPASQTRTTRQQRRRPLCRPAARGSIPAVMWLCTSNYYSLSVMAASCAHTRCRALPGTLQADKLLLVSPKAINLPARIL